jgi:hypothetical protein
MTTLMTNDDNDAIASECKHQPESRLRPIKLAATKGNYDIRTKCSRYSVQTGYYCSIGSPTEAEAVVGDLCSNIYKR